VLKEGEMLYIPSLWWHHIESLEVSFSVFFWWGRRREMKGGVEGGEGGRNVCRVRYVSRKYLVFVG